MYIPESLTKKDKKKQKKMILKSKKLYKEKKYYIREKLKSFKSKKSKYIERAKKMYHVKSIKPNKELSKKTGCNISTLKKIIKKGEGAYYSSGSRPNQTPRAGGLARLASAITGGKSSRIDFQEIKTGCQHKKKAFVLANKRIKND